MKVGLACGGTGGHIFPGLATASKLNDKGHDVVLWLAGKDVERDAASLWKGPIHIVPAEGLPSRPSLQFLPVLLKFFHAFRVSKRLMLEDPPDVLLAMGSYASVGPICAALHLKIPFVLHEANVLPGRAISLFSRWATAVAGSFEETRYYLRKMDIVITGMPLRYELEESLKKEKAAQAIGENSFSLLVMGGSRGSVALNRVVSEAAVHIAKQLPGFCLHHVAGVGNKEPLENHYKAFGVSATVYEFIHDIAPLYRKADLAICRAGAATAAELVAFGVPALLVPYPYASHNHQMVNARALEKIGAADVISEQDLTESWLADYVLDCIGSLDKLAKMKASSKKRARYDSAEALASVVERAVQKNGH